MGRFVMLALGIAFSALFIALYLLNRDRYKKMVEGVNQSAFFLSDIFSVGIFLVEKLNIPTGKAADKTKAKYAELFGKPYVEFYCMISIAASISYVLLFMPFAFLFGALANEAGFVMLGIMLAAIIVVYLRLNIDNMIKEQREEILLDYPVVLSRMALLINAGMMLRDAWKTVGESSDTKLYREMQNTIKLINNGYSEVQAYEELAVACKVGEIKKFVSVICQNMEKGSSELVHIMRELSTDAWTAKKNVAKMKGDSATTKLTFPLMLSFVAILIMILVPIVANIDFGF